MARVNIILLGESDVGKTTVVNRFETGEFPEYELPHTVAGVVFCKKTLWIEGNEVNLFMWDTRGQKMFNSVVRSYYRGQQGALLVYDVTDPESFYELSKWLTELRSVNENAVILIAGNKHDDPSKKRVTVSMVKNFARDKNLDYMEISAKTGENVVEAFDYLVRKILTKKGILSSDGLPKEKMLPDKEEEEYEIISLTEADHNSSTSTTSSCARWSFFEELWWSLTSKIDL